MTLESEIDILRRVSFFADFPLDPLKLIAFSAETHAYADKAVLFKEGDVADSGLVVMQGRVDLVRYDAGAPHILTSLGPSNLVGELALIIETTRSARAVSHGPSRVLIIRRAMFRRVLAEYPIIAETLHSRIAQRLVKLAPELGRLAKDLEEGR